MQRTTGIARQRLAENVGHRLGVADEKRMPDCLGDEGFQVDRLDRNSRVIRQLQKQLVGSGVRNGVHAFKIDHKELLTERAEYCCSDLLSRSQMRQGQIAERDVCQSWIPPHHVPPKALGRCAAGEPVQSLTVVQSTDIPTSDAGSGKLAG
jgi:hypothetical protein